MELSEEEMDAILAMYEVATWEGQETDIMINLVERIKKEKKIKELKAMEKRVIEKITEPERWEE